MNAEEWLQLVLQGLVIGASILFTYGIFMHRRTDRSSEALPPLGASPNLSRSLVLCSDGNWYPLLVLKPQLMDAADFTPRILAVIEALAVSPPEPPKGRWPSSSLAPAVVHGAKLGEPSRVVSRTALERDPLPPATE